GSQQIIRVFPLKQQPWGIWQIRFNYGVLEVTIDNNLVAIGYTDAGYHAPSALVFASTSGSIACKSLIVTALTYAISPQIEEKAKVITESSNHEMAYRKGRVAEALQTAKDILGPLRDLYGPNSPQIGALLQNIGVYLSHLGDAKAARSYLDEALQIALS